MTPGERIEVIWRARRAAGAMNAVETLAQLAEFLGVTYETLRKWREGKASPTAPRQKVIAARLQCTPGDFMGWEGRADNGIGEPKPTTTRPAPAGMNLPDSVKTLNPTAGEDAPEVEWGERMHERSPVFWVALPDDAMAPRAPAGKLICFDTRETPRPGDGVLVQDARGDYYFRRYTAGAGGRWKATALNENFDPLDSEAHGLRVVAVLKAEEGRWG